MSINFTPQLSNEYQSLFDTCIVRPEKSNEIESNVNSMKAHKDRYDAVADQLNIPWYFIAIIHCLEASLKFNTHLHNGDPLTARTVQVPAGRPLTGNPPFTWEASAIDALTLEGFAANSDWSIPHMLFAFEKYNGFGYRSKGINSPYLWSGSNQYTKGKFVQDGKFDSEAISKQTGAAVLLKRILDEQGEITMPAIDLTTQIKNLGEQVNYDAHNFNPMARQLQTLLNRNGEHLEADGKAGDFTSEAYQRVSGKFLKGDVRRVDVVGV
jgi:lysozyme family protein